MKEQWCFESTLLTIPIENYYKLGNWCNKYTVQYGGQLLEWRGSVNISWSRVIAYKIIVPTTRVIIQHESRDASHAQAQLTHLHKVQQICPCLHNNLWHSARLSVVQSS